ncbi:hypothetical protein AJ80_04409 [Polytolypa hystricis UAMH7299]|uniref:Cytochrome c oxidase assembly protein COX20, mitochondrial n=1 Tax=Polytolypa hystricis (strain UAMH7299) TaxID=1447883 RepID=A0A2B7YC75_POLH7|nr:hypothetical protein AJ80_04409 [Polytolypa hystricis UAMH7299]
MAEDSRDAQTPGGGLSTPEPKKPKHDFPKSQVSKLWEEFGNPEEPVNLMPGAAYNSAGGKPKEVTLKDTITSMSIGEIAGFYKVPCARESLLVGIGTGFGVGSIRVILGGLRVLWPACNWAVGSFAVASLITHEICQRQRVIERDGMREAVELMKELKLKKQQERDEARKAAVEAARLADEERQRKSWTKLSNYKFW